MPLETRPNLPDSAYQLTHAGPDQWEQLQLELINFARANPAGEASRQQTSLGANVSATPSQALAFNADLLDAAQLHSDRMLSQNFFAHDDPFSGTTPFDRIVAQGYQYRNAGENLSWIGSFANDAFTADRIQAHHDNLWNSIGHREAFMNDTYGEVGIGYAVGSYSEEREDGEVITYPHSSMVTQNFGNNDTTFLTGVVIDDLDNDNFYDPGEGQGAVKITAYNGSGSFATSSWASGGYSLALEDGTYTVVYEGGGLDGYFERSVTVNGANVKVDVIEDRDVLAYPAQPSLPQMAQSASAFDASAATEFATLAGVDGRISGSAAELNGDRIAGFDKGDMLVFEGVNFSAKQVGFNASTGALNVNSVGVNAQMNLSGSFSNNGLLVFRDGANTHLRPETLVVSFKENTSIGSGNVNGVVVDDYLSGSNAANFVLRSEANAGAKFANSIGKFEITSSGAIVDVEILAHDARAASTMTVNGVNGGNELAFFIIQNGGNTMSDAVLNSGSLGLRDIGGTMRLTDGGALVEAATVFVSHDASLNPDNMEHAVSGLARDGSGAVVIGFEDLMRTGSSDDDFQDVAFQVEAIYDIV